MVIENSVKINVVKDEELWIDDMSTLVSARVSDWTVC